MTEETTLGTEGGEALRRLREAAKRRRMSVIDPQTWADAEDGRALRELREALPEGWTEPLITFQWFVLDGKPMWAGGAQDSDDLENTAFNHGTGDTIAAAADAARAALVKR